MGAFKSAAGAVTDWTSTDNPYSVEVNKNDLNVGRTCRHPTDAVRWDEHRALLRCTSCGRKIEDGADLSIQRHLAWLGEAPASPAVSGPAPRV